MPATPIPPLVVLDRRTNLNDVLAARVAATPLRPLIERKTSPGGPWLPVTAREYDEQIVAVAKGLVALGVEPGDRVGLMARTRYEWSLLDWAIWAVGAVGVPIYETSSAEQVQWICADAAVQFAVVENQELAAVVGQVRDRLPELRELLVIDDGGIDALVAGGRDVPDDQIARRRHLATLDDLATIIYTSGTTGRPKGVALTHGNFAELTANAARKLAVVLAGEGVRTLLFMPLAHVFARFLEVVAVAGGAVLGHTPDTRTLVADMASFRPTFVLSVPRVFEKVYTSAQQSAPTGLKRSIFALAAKTAIVYSRALDTPGGPHLRLRMQHRMADLLVLRKIRAALGGRLRWAICGGAPLGERLGHFFRGAGLVVLEGYGLTETTAPVSVNLPECSKIGTVGPALPGCGLRIADDGEIEACGIGIFRGYHRNDEANAEAFHGEWLRTGDLGVLDADGYLRITGRKKEIIVTAGGKNVAPSILEDRLRGHPLVSQVVVVGDQRPFVGALITLDPEGVPGWLAAHGKPPLSLADAARDPDLLASLDRAVTRTNQVVSRAESIRKFRILPADLTIENGYLTPKLSVRRAEVLHDFAAEIDALYGG